MWITTWGFVYLQIALRLEMISSKCLPSSRHWMLDQQKMRLYRRLRQTTTVRIFTSSDWNRHGLFGGCSHTNRLWTHQARHLSRRLNEVEKEQFDDAMIEARQLLPWRSIKVLQHLSGSYDNIPTTWTTWAICPLLRYFRVIAVITGFFGWMFLYCLWLSVQPDFSLYLVRSLFGSPLRCWLVHK